MDVAFIQSITVCLSYYAPYVILVVDNIGCICNSITFTSKLLRRNPCGWYFLMSTLFDFCFINFSLFTKLSIERFDSTLQDTNLAWCKISSFLTWVLPCIATGYIVLTSIDRCLSTSTSTRLRSFSQLKIAYRITCVPIILYTVISCHQLVFYDLRPTCSPQPGIYEHSLSIYGIVWTDFIPEGTMLVFGWIIYYNIRKNRQHQIHPTEEQSQRTRVDSQLVNITLAHVISSLVLRNLSAAYYIYTVLTVGLTKSIYRITMEKLITQISDVLFYLNFGKSFYLNVITSKFFRRIFKERLMVIYIRITWWKMHVQSIETTRLDYIGTRTITQK